MSATMTPVRNVLATVMAGKDSPSITIEQLNAKVADAQEVCDAAMALYDSMNDTGTKYARTIELVSNYIVTYSATKSEVLALLNDPRPSGAMDRPVKYNIVDNQLVPVFAKPAAKGKGTPPPQVYKQTASLIYKLAAWNVQRWDFSIVKATGLERDLVNDTTLAQLHEGIVVNGKRYTDVVSALIGDGKPNGVHKVERAWQNIFRPSITNLDKLNDGEYTAAFKAAEEAAEKFSVPSKGADDMGNLKKVTTYVSTTEPLFLGALRGLCTAHLMNADGSRGRKVAARIIKMIEVLLTPDSPEAPETV